jgi:hypothetical protein
MTLSPNESALRDALVRALAVEPDEPWSKELARSAIVGSDLDAICCRAPEGWPAGKACMFGRLFVWTYREHLDGRPWKPRATETERRAKGL